MLKIKMSKIQWMLVVIFSIIFFISLDLNGYRKTVSRVTIEPVKDNTGLISLRVEGPYYRYLYSGWLRIPPSGWELQKSKDSKILTAKGTARRLEVYSEGEPIRIGLLHNANSGSVRLVDGTGASKEIDLHADTESETNLIVGGPNSDFPSVEKPPFPIWVSIVVFVFIFWLLSRIAGCHSPQSTYTQIKPPRRFEIFIYALPLLLSTTIVMLAYWPGNVSFDGSLQWYQATTRGHIDPLMGVLATLFLRLFTYFSTSPAWPILLQSVFAAFGVALILYELRYRGVPRAKAQFFSIVLALLPQYPIFFTNLGKDGLSAIGLLFVAWALLTITRRSHSGRLAIAPTIILLIAAVYAAMMRINVLPTVLLAVTLIAVIFVVRGMRIVPLVLVAAFICAIIFIPKIVIALSDEHQSANASSNIEQASPSDYSSVYVYHLFSAAVFKGIELDPSDTQPFYRLAPRNAWQNYTCYMSDTTFTAVSDATPLSIADYSNVFNQVRPELIHSILRIIRHNPNILLERQKCITELIWYIGFRQTPFQTTATYGYENVSKDFVSLVGANHSLISDNVRVLIQQYISYTESPRLFWLIWKPAFIGYLGLYCSLLYLTVRRDIGILLYISLPITLTLVMLVVIPFPAYRYQFPAALLFSLLCLLPFTMTSNLESNGKTGKFQLTG